MGIAIESVKTRLAQLAAGKSKRSGTLTIVPLSSPRSGNRTQYTLLEDAMGAGVVSVSEKSEGGSVPELLLRNEGACPVLLIEGEILEGAKQNRTLNATLLAKERGATAIPVSCVERGRWRYKSRDFSKGSHTSPSLRSTKSKSVHQRLKQTRDAGMGTTIESYRSNQGAVWNEVDTLLQDTQTMSGTACFSDASARHRRSIEDVLGELIPAVEGACGIAAFIEDRFVGLDAFDRPETFEKVKRQLLEGYALEALGTRDADGEGREDLEGSTRAILARAAGGEVEEFPSAGLGSDIRLEVAEELVGAALARDEEVFHLAVFPAR